MVLNASDSSAKKKRNGKSPAKNKSAGNKPPLRKMRRKHSKQNHLEQYNLNTFQKYYRNKKLELEASYMLRHMIENVTHTLFVFAIPIFFFC